MLCCGITDLVEKPPWRIAVPILARTIEFGDLAAGAAGFAVSLPLMIPMFLIGLPIFFPTFVVLFCVLGSITFRYLSPQQIGWRNYITAAWGYYLALRSARSGGAVDSGDRYILYLSPWVRCKGKLHRKATQIYLIPRHTHVRPDYDLREKD